MVVVPKVDEQVRGCNNITNLNELKSVKHEWHILPSVEETLVQVGGTTLFSKLDANSGFWQIELSKDSALQTTFITRLG